MRLSHALFLVVIAAASGCASPGLPFDGGMSLAGDPGMGMSNASLRQSGLATLWQTTDWSGAPGRPIQLASYEGVTAPAGMPVPQTEFACNQPCCPSGCNSGRSTGPVRGYLRSLFGREPARTCCPAPACPGQRLTPQAPAGAAPMALAPETMQRPMPLPAPEPSVPEAVAPMPTQPVAAEEPAYRPLPDGNAPASGPQLSSPSAAASAPAAPSRTVPTPPASAPDTAADESAPPPGPPVHVVGERSIRLQGKMRDVGPSGVSAVELWFTQDGQHWKKAERLLSPQPPYALDVTEDGRYGIILIPRSGAGMSRQPPMLGEPPQVWVEVDTTRPTVEVGSSKFVSSAQGTELAITWTARDRNLRARPIRLSYADKPQGPWRTIAETENTGSYQWRLSGPVPPSLFIRVEAVDNAGNVGMAVTHDPIVLDLSRPAIDILSVESNRKR